MGNNALTLEALGTIVLHVDENHDDNDSDKERQFDKAGNHFEPAIDLESC